MKRSKLIKILGHCIQRFLDVLINYRPIVRTPGMDKVAFIRSVTKKDIDLSTLPYNQVYGGTTQ